MQLAAQYKQYNKTRDDNKTVLTCDQQNRRQSAKMYGLLSTESKKQLGWYYTLFIAMYK